MGEGLGMRAKQSASQRSNCGAQNQDSASARGVMRNKNPENKNRFRGLKSNQDSREPISFFYPDCNCRLWNYTRSCAKHSWAVPPIGNCTLPRRFLFGCCDYIVICSPRVYSLRLFLSLVSAIVCATPNLLSRLKINQRKRKGIQPRELSILNNKK